jgi:hypothetical protein
MRVIGIAMLLYGGVMLALLFTPWRGWALDHSIAEVVSYSDQRMNNQVRGRVDEPMAIAGSAVLVFAGLWFAFLVPWVINRNHRRIVAEAGYDDATGGDAAA